MRPDRWTKSLLAAVLLLSAAAPAWAKGFEDFTLAGAIPADAILAVHTRGHEGKTFIKEQMARVWKEVEKAKFDRDLKRLFKQGAMDGGMTEEDFNAKWDKAMTLCQSVDWANLAAVEYAMGMRMTAMGPGLMPEYVVLLKPPADGVEKNFAGLSGMLEELAKLNEAELVYTSEGEGAQQVNKLGFKNAPFPINFAIARRDDTLLLSFGQNMIEQTLALMGGEGDALGKSERFQAAFKELPAPVDSAVFFDAAKMMKQMRGVMDEAMKQMPAPPADDPAYAEHEKWTALGGKVFDEVDIFDYIASVGETADKKITAESVVALRDNAKDAMLYKIMFSNGPLSDPLKHVPSSAANFSASAGINPGKSLDLILDFVRANVPDGEQVDGHLEQIKAETGFDLRADVLGWIEGRFVSFSIPGPNPYSPGEWVLMLSASDAAKGGALLAKLVELGKAQLGENGSITPASVGGAEGFYTLKAPMLAMMQMSAPTFGVTSGWLYAGSSPGIIETSMKVAAGDEANFSKNERFAKEGLPLSSTVTGASFSDLTGLGESLGTAFQAAGMVSMFMGEAAQQEPARTLISVATKVGRVLRALDFFQSSASEVRLDGNVLRTRQVTNLREPPKPAKPGTETKASEEPANEPG